MKKLNVYVASSWRNDYQQAVVGLIKSHGHNVYDFKNTPGSSGFSWSEIDPNWKHWNMKQFADIFDHPRVVNGFKNDFMALHNCDVCVMVLPCGRSAHLEAGYAAGGGKTTIAFIPEGVRIEPELMYGILNGIFTTVAELDEFFKPV